MTAGRQLRIFFKSKGVSCDTSYERYLNHIFNDVLNRLSRCWEIIKAKKYLILVNNRYRVIRKTEPSAIVILSFGNMTPLLLFNVRMKLSTKFSNQWLDTIVEKINGKRDLRLPHMQGILNPFLNIFRFIKSG